MAALLVLLPGAAGAVEGTALIIDSVEGTDWSADGIEIRVTRGADRSLGASVRVARLTLPDPIGEIGELMLRCDAVRLEKKVIVCAGGTALVRGSPLDERAFPVSATYERRGGRLTVATKRLPWQGLDVAVDANWSASGWRGRLGARGIGVTSFYSALGSVASGFPALGFSAGRIDFDIRLTGGPDGPRRLDGTAALHDLALANEAGTLATEGLGLTAELQADLGATDNAIDYTLSVATNAGEAYLEPAYLNLDESPLTLTAVGRLAAGAERLEVASFDLEHRSVIAASGSTVLVRGEELRMEKADIDIGAAIFPGVYSTYLQGFLTGTPLARLETRGRMRGALRINGGRLDDLRLHIHELSADDAQQRLALYGASGEIAWSRQPAAEPRRSRLAWDGGFVYSVGFGAAEAVLHSSADTLVLAGGLRVPFLDGAFAIDTFEARGLTGETPNIVFDARLEPVSLAGITTALGWPALRGKLSGELPLLSVSEGEVTLGGELTARVFDGRVRIADLQIEQPFGANRRTSANVTLENLDLGLVTDVFTFGRITGRLDGDIRGLEMLQGRPTAFDASFYTPPDDDSRHLISRRALSNISEIAGGGTALLSGGFLSLFQEFRYDTLGISCVLEGDVCRMSGVKPAETGYYLVKGSGLPRIDVIGHSRQVNWPRLVAQIAEALRSREVATTAQSEGQR